MNVVILKGNVGADPELKYTPSGTAVINFSIATSQRWKDAHGQPQEKTDWHRCTAWKKTAEIIGEYVKKGSQILVQGRIETRTWDDNSGKKQFITEVIVEHFEFCGKNERSNNSRNDSPPAEQHNPEDDFPQPPEDDLPF